MTEDFPNELRLREKAEPFRETLIRIALPNSRHMYGCIRHSGIGVNPIDETRKLMTGGLRAAVRRFPRTAARKLLFEVFVHHSSVSREERAAAEERFGSGSNACIVCTSTLELGIDVGDLDLVFQVDAPATVSSFLQRMSRTGRRPGTTANTTFFCQTSEAVLRAIALVELAREKWVEPVAVNTRCWPVLAHQVLALTLQFGGVSRERCRKLLAPVPSFSGIGEAEFAGLIDHMVTEGYLFEAGGLLSMGENAERRFGRKNFMELYAVFSSPVLYRVATSAGRDLGSLEQDFVEGLVPRISSFLLGGLAWAVDHIDHTNRLVRVIEAP